jgi:hypothetical protein
MSSSITRDIILTSKECNNAIKGKSYIQRHCCDSVIRDCREPKKKKKTADPTLATLSQQWPVFTLATMSSNSDSGYFNDVFQ